MKIKLIFGRICTDYNTCWTGLKEIEVNVPDFIVYPQDKEGMRYLIGVLIPDKDVGIGG